MPGNPRKDTVSRDRFEQDDTLRARLLRENGIDRLHLMHKIRHHDTLAAANGCRGSRCRLRQRGRQHRALPAVAGRVDVSNVVTDNLKAGLLRRAVLEAGRRLAASGKLADPAHVFDLTVEEIAGLLGGTGPTSAELAKA